MNTIKNGKDTPLNAKAGSVPQLQGALQGWYQPMTFIIIGKFLDSGFLKETGTPVNFRGVMMPYKPRQLDIKRQGQRKWKWWTLFCTPELQLAIDDGVAYLAEQMRCMALEDWKLYGFMKYTLIEDYEGTIQNLVYDPDTAEVVDDGNKTAPAELVTDDGLPDTPPAPGNTVNE